MDLASQVTWLQAMNERLIALNEQLVHQRSADQEERRALLDLVRELSRTLSGAETSLASPPSAPPRVELQEPPPAGPSPEISSGSVPIPSGAEFQKTADSKDLSGLFMSPASASRKASDPLPIPDLSSKLTEFTDFEFFPEDHSKA